MHSLKSNNGKQHNIEILERIPKYCFGTVCHHLFFYQFAKNFWIKKVCRLLAHIDQRSPWAFIFIIIAFYFLWFWQNRVWYLSLGCEIIWEWVDLMVIGRDPRWGLGSGLGHHDADTRSIADGSVTMPGAGKYRRWPSGALPSSRQSLPNLHPDSDTLITCTKILEIS